jgi:methylated-DNA-[protein]-cysteine S-methyltransferase
MTSNGQGFALFDTPIGRCGIAWGDRGIVAVQLPERREAETRARMVRRFPGAVEAAPPTVVQRAVENIVGLLRGETVDLSAVALDLEGVPAFHRRVYEAARRIPAGRTISYGEIAQRIGARGAARAVGQALGRNPFAIVVPCHRVLAAGGRVGGFSANGGIDTKLRLLTIEGTHRQQSPRAASKPAAVVSKPGRVGKAGRVGSGDGGFGFDVDGAVAHLRAADPALGRLIETVGPFAMGLQRTTSLFVALAQAIVYQQLTAKAAGTIFGRVQALFSGGRRGPTPAQILAASDEQLRGAGLSRGKLLALRDLAAKARAGEIPRLADIHRMEDEAIVERLVQVRGIGRWTVQMLLIFRLGRPDVLPVDDYGIRKGFAATFHRGKKRAQLPTPKEVAARGARWKPYCTVASWYLWRAVDLAKK